MNHIDNIQFSIASAEEIERSSVVEIIHHDIYEKGNPKPGGLYDLRMGTTDRIYKCQTCKGDIVSCPGHFGHIKLCMPVFHVGYQKTLHKILQSVCLYCSKPLTNKKYSSFKKCYDLIRKEAECPHCEEKQPRILLEQLKYYTINNTNETITKEPLSSDDVYNICTKISDESIQQVGLNQFCKPANMLMTVLPVPPPQVRPTIVMDTNVKSQDDLTHKLCEIVKSNNTLSKYLNTENQNSSITQSMQDLLQFHINTYIDNENSGKIQATQRTGRPIKGIFQRLKSKEGRVRGNLMGKRVDFSARTVITADPNIDLDQLGVPHKIAVNITYPETVTYFNRKILQSYVDSGPTAPLGKIGAKFVITSTGETRDLRYSKNLKIRPGDIVERHMKDDDVVIFNRQPSLHKMSMMGHRVKIMNNSTFRMNLSATSPYNADFDGDEMNLHMPQNEITKSEIKELMMVPKNIVSPQSNKPVIGIVQDALLSSRKMSNRNTFLTKVEVMDIMMKIRHKEVDLPVPAILKPKELWTGKQMIELLFPNDLNFERKSGWHDDNDVNDIGDTNVVIKNGKYISGTLCKKSLGTSEGGLVHTFWLEYGPQETCHFISNLQYIVNMWILHNGFTVGLGDTVTNRHVRNEVANAIETAKEKVNQLIKVSKTYEVDQRILEGKLNNELNNAMAKSGKQVQEGIKKTNNIYTMVSGGSKGSVINIAQIMGCVGQQNIGGARVSMGYTDRVIPHFERKDIGPEAKGFVETSYYKGLKPHEFFYHAMGGREGIIDTAVKTSETGYIQRRLSKSMEDLKISFDRSLRNSIGDIVQFLYGEDGYDSTFLLSQKHGKSKVRSPVYFERILKKYENIYEETSHSDSTQYVHSIMNQIFIKESQSMKDLAKSYYQRMCDMPREIVDLVAKQIKEQLKRAYVQNGEMVGTLAAQSIGEPTTQLALNSFHFSGISAKTMTLGVPRFKEIINVAKTIKSPSMTIYLKETNSRERTEEIACSIEYCLLKSLVSTYEVVPTQETEYSELYTKCYEQENESNLMIRFFIDRYKMFDKQTNLLRISTAIMKEYNETLFITTSNENGDKLFIDIRMFNEYTEVALKEFAIKLMNTTSIHGNINISKTFITNENNNWIIETDGSDLITALGDKRFDSTKTISNNPTEIYEILGIEAARASLMREIKQVIEYDGGYVNYRHFSVLVDTMTYRGMIMSITRHGINRAETGPLMKCSFEETVDVLIDAAASGEKDSLKGVTETITVGKLSNLGTGNIGVRWNGINSIGESEEKYFRPMTPSEDQWEESTMDLNIETEESYFPW